MDNTTLLIRNGYILIAMVAIISYLIGSVNFSILLSRIIGKKDIRESGSGNAGATNMLRTYGKKMGVITLLLDVAKGIAAILLANFLAQCMADMLNYMFYDPMEFAKYVAGVCVVLGHNFPLYFRFKGGKGVATSLGVVLMLDWRVGLVVAVIAIAIIAITRYVSLGSIIGGALYIVIAIAAMVYDCIQRTTFSIEYSLMDKIMKAIHHVFTTPYFLVRIFCVVIIGGLLIIRHHANIKRLLNGTENKLGAKKEK